MASNHEHSLIQENLSKNIMFETFEKEERDSKFGICKDFL